jgi:hypothetical protein
MTLASLILNSALGFAFMPVDHYENFPVASILLPGRLRPAVEAIYALPAAPTIWPMKATPRPSSGWPI